MKRKLAFALFLGLVSFAVFFLLQTLKKSVLFEAVPEIMQTSYYSTVYIYIHLAFVINTVYYIVYYDYLFFSEIRKNSWYMLIKMGYRPAVMILLKFVALLSSVVLIFSVGFCVIVLLTVLLKYSFVYAYLPSLYFSGLVDLLLVTALSLTLSLFAGTVASARYRIAFSALAIFLLKAVTGFYAILSNRVIMQRFSNLFDLKRSAFMAISGALLLLCMVFSAFRASGLAKYYVIHEVELARLADGVTLGRVETGAGLAGAAKQRQERRLKLFNAMFTTVAVLVISLVLLFNVLIILLSTAAPGNEMTIRGVIPYIFQSDTMQPDIMYNDLAYFKRVDHQYPVMLGQIVLFQQDNEVYVERIIEINGPDIKVDIDHYPPLSDAGVMIKTVNRSAIYGVFNGRNRWLGALILFSNTIVGRLLFLLVPVVLLFFKPQVLKFIRKRH